MKYLLDTATFLWIIFGEEEKLSSKATKALKSANNSFLLSSVSSWEIAIKYQQGKLKLKKEPWRLIPEILLELGLQSLAIEHRHATAVAKLPWHHKDPFDRLLIAQAKVEKLSLMSPDRIFKKYHTPCLW